MPRSPRDNTEAFMPSLLFCYRGALLGAWQYDSRAYKRHRWYVSGGSGALAAAALNKQA